MGTFAADIRAWCDKTKDDADKIVRFALMTLDGRVISRSPVGDPSKWATPLTKSRKTGKMHFNSPAGYVGGRFRANWQLAHGSPPAGVLDIKDKDGSATKASHEGFIAATKAGGVVYLCNNLPYAKRLEDGWSRNQAPIGMVAVTVVEWNNIVDDAVKAIK